MKILVTAGPAYEPIDQVRRITNHSTGRLGSGLCHFLRDAGHEVTCLLGQSAIIRPDTDIRTLEFNTNESLLELLEKESALHTYTALFHAAALSDYRVTRITDSLGIEAPCAKISSREGGLTLHLEPAVKILPQLRRLFPQALIVGWKYELDGSRNHVIEKGLRQLGEAHNDAVVLNGTAWGEGFGLLDCSGQPELLPHTEALYRKLTQLITS